VRTANIIQEKKMVDPNRRRRRLWRQDHSSSADDEWKYRSEEERPLLEKELELEESRIPVTIQRFILEKEKIATIMTTRNDAFAVNKHSSNRYMDSALTRGNINLASLRSASQWGGMGNNLSPSDEYSERTSALQGRLKELLVFELHKDG
jgi:hypothetical protein